MRHLTISTALLAGCLVAGAAWAQGSSGRFRRGHGRHKRRLVLDRQRHPPRSAEQFDPSPVRAVNRHAGKRRSR